jgi:hypothetical protein
MNSPKRVERHTKLCRYCERYKPHIFKGRYGTPRETAAGNFVQRPFYVDEKGRRWFDSKCNLCYRKYMKERRRKQREILKRKSVGPVGGDRDQIHPNSGGGGQTVPAVQTDGNKTGGDV